MTTWMRNLSVLGVAVILAVASTGCDDDDTNGVPNSTTTTTSSTTTTTGTTTSTSTSSTSTTSVTSTSTSTTTTTIGGPTFACVVTFGVTSSETIGALQWDTDYSAAPGGFNGSGGNVPPGNLECTQSAALGAAGAFSSYNDIEAETVVKSAAIAAGGFTGPIELASCNFTSTDAGLAAGDFTLTVTDASDPAFNPITPTVAITNVVCTGGSTTTTTTVPTSTTSTTTGTNTTTTTGGGGNLYNVAIDLADAVTAGALQFEVDYSAAGGQFTGSGATPPGGTLVCTSPLSSSGGFVAFNDIDANSQLNVAITALAGFTGPTTVANCEFDAPTAPAPGDFAITVVDASDPNLNPIVPFPSVTVSAITPK